MRLQRNQVILLTLLSLLPRYHQHLVRGLAALEQLTLGMRHVTKGEGLPALHCVRTGHSVISASLMHSNFESQHYVIPFLLTLASMSGISFSSTLWCSIVGPSCRTLYFLPALCSSWKDPRLERAWDPNRASNKARTVNLRTALLRNEDKGSERNAIPGRDQQVQKDIQETLLLGTGLRYRGWGNRPSHLGAHQPPFELQQ